MQHEIRKTSTHNPAMASHTLAKKIKKANRQVVTTAKKTSNPDSRNKRLLVGIRRSRIEYVITYGIVLVAAEEV